MSFIGSQKRWLPTIIVCGAVLSTSCAKHGPTNNEPTSSESYSTTPPFQTKEPDNYQAIRKLTFTDPEGNSKTVQTLIARSGELRREETETSSQPVVYLDSTHGSFILLPREKIYAQANEETEESATTPDDPDRLVHTEPVKVKYQKMGTEVIGNRNLTKYKVVNTSADGTVTNSETVIWVDESLGMPVRSESSSNDKSRTTMELTDVSLEVEKKVFDLPSDYQRVAATELRRRLHRD